MNNTWKIIDLNSGIFSFKCFFCLKNRFLYKKFYHCFSCENTFYRLIVDFSERITMLFLSQIEFNIVRFNSGKNVFFSKLYVTSKTFKKKSCMPCSLWKYFVFVFFYLKESHGKSWKIHKKRKMPIKCFSIFLFVC